MKTLIGDIALQTRIADMASEIDSYYAEQDWYRKTQEPVIVIGVLTGAIFFMADLVRKLSIRTELDFIKVSTYPGKTTTAQTPKITFASTRRLHNSHILLLDDILDSGKTIRTIKTNLPSEDVQVAVLLRKLTKAPFDVVPDFVGFDIPNKWVAGYGMDDNERRREISVIFEV